MAPIQTGERHRKETRIPKRMRVGKVEAMPVRPGRLLRRLGWLGHREFDGGCDRLRLNRCRFRNGRG